MTARSRVPQYAVLLVLLGASISFGQENDADDEDKRLLKEMSDYPNFVKSTRQRFDDFMEKYEEDNAVEDEEKDEDSVDEAWEESLNQVDPRYAAIVPSEKAHGKYLDALYRKFMATGETPSGKTDEVKGSTTFPQQMWFPQYYSVPQQLKDNYFFDAVAASRQIDQQQASVVGNSQRRGYGSSVIDMGDHMWYGSTAVATGSRHNSPNPQRRGFGGGSEGVIGTNDVRDVSSTERNVESLFANPAALSFATTALLEEKESTKSRRHLRGGARRLLMKSVADGHDTLMHPVQNLEQSALFSVNQKEDKPVDPASLGCHPLCLPAAKLPHDATSQASILTMPNADPEHLGINPISAAKILTWPPLPPGSPRLAPSFYSAENKDYMFRQPNLNSPYDRIALYESAPYRSMGNPPSVGKDGKEGFYPMVQVGQATPPAPRTPSFRPPPIRTTNYDVYETPALSATQWTGIGATLGAVPYPNMPLFPSVSSADAKAMAGIKTDLTKLPAHGNPAKVETSSSFLEIGSRSSNDWIEKSSADPKWFYRQFEVNGKPLLEYNYMHLAGDLMKAKAVEDNSENSQSARGITLGDGGKDDLTKMPVVRTAFGEPIQTTQYSAPPPLSAMGFERMPPRGIHYGGPWRVK